MTGVPASPRPPVTITVRGRPAPQGSKRAFAYTPRGGGKPRASMIEQTSKHLTPWREDVRAACEKAREVTGCTCDSPDTGAGLAHRDWCGILPPITGPLELEMVFYLARPKSHYRTGRNAHILRDSAPSYPHGTPDLSKLARATEDAIVSAGLIADDALIVCYRELAKYYVAFPDISPGAFIAIRQLDDQAATAT